MFSTLFRTAAITSLCLSISACMTATGMIASSHIPDGAKELPSFSDPILAELQTMFIQHQREYYGYKRDFSSLENAGSECPTGKLMSTDDGSYNEKLRANQQQISDEIMKLTGAGSNIRIVNHPAKDIQLRVLEGDCNGGNFDGTMKMLLSFTARMDIYGTMRSTDETRSAMLIIGEYSNGTPQGNLARVAVDIKTFAVKPDGSLIPKNLGLIAGDINDRIEDMPAMVMIEHYQNGEMTHSYSNMKSMMGAVHTGWVITAIEPAPQGGMVSTTYQGKNIHTITHYNEEGQLHGRYKTFYNSEYVKDIDVCFENNIAVATTDC